MQDSFKVLCGGYCRDAQSGAHHLTVCSPLNEGANGSAFGAIVAHDDRLELHSPAIASLVAQKDVEMALREGAALEGNVLKLWLAARR